MIEVRIATATGRKVMLTRPESEAVISDSAVRWTPCAVYINSPITGKISHPLNPKLFGELIGRFVPRFLKPSKTSSIKDAEKYLYAATDIGGIPEFISAL